MIFIGQYDELNPGKGYPSMRGFISETPYPGKDLVYYYLTHGREDIIRMSIPKDVFNGKTIPMDYTGMNDGEYTWFKTLAYYVKNYNLRLPKKFEEKILKSFKALQK